MKDSSLEKRKHNTVIYRVPEKKIEDAMILLLLKIYWAVQFEVEESDIEKMYRVGRWEYGK